MSGALSQLGFRLAQALGVALVVGLLSFLMMQALPGDAAFRIAAGRYGYDLVTAEAAAAVRAELGLDRGPVAAFLGWMADLARLNLGTSLVSGERVAEEIAHQLGASLQLAVAALALSLLIGPPLGLWAGLYAGGRFDRALLVASAAFRSVPQFLMGLVLIVVLAVQFRLLPAAGPGRPRISCCRPSRWRWGWRPPRPGSPATRWPGSMRARIMPLPAGRGCRSDRCSGVTGCAMWRRRC